MRKTAKAARGIGAGMSLKSGLVVGGTVGLGAAMLLTQFVTMGIADHRRRGRGRPRLRGVHTRQEKIVAARRLAAWRRRPFQGHRGPGPAPGHYQPGAAAPAVCRRTSLTGHDGHTLL